MNFAEFWFTAINGKQNKLTFDSTPTLGSSNPVTSDGVYQAIANSQGFECSIALCENSSGGGYNIGTFTVDPSGSSYTGYYWSSSSSDPSSSISYPYGTPSVYLVSGPGAVTLPSTMNSYSGVFPILINDISPVIISAKGSGIVRIYGSFYMKSRDSTSPMCSKSSTERLYIEIHISNGVLDHVESNIYFIYSAASPSRNISLFDLNHFEVL